MAQAFEYAQAEEVRDTFARHGVRYLFLGKSGAILLGFPDTTQDADLFVEKTRDNAKGCNGLRRRTVFGTFPFGRCPRGRDRSIGRTRGCCWRCWPTWALT